MKSHVYIAVDLISQFCFISLTSLQIIKPNPLTLHMTQSKCYAWKQRAQLPYYKLNRHFFHLIQILKEPPTQSEEYEEEAEDAEKKAAEGQGSMEGQQIEFEILDESVAKQHQQEQEKMEQE